LDNEYVVLVNTGKVQVDLSGWKLVSSVGGQTYALPAGTSLKPGTSISIVSGVGGKKGTGTLFWTGSNVWNNSGDPALLYNAAGAMVSKYE
jgi:hypothetical protein